MSMMLLKRWNAMGPCDFTTWCIQNIPIKIKQALKESCEHNSVIKAVRMAALFSFQSSWLL